MVVDSPFGSTVLIGVVIPVDKVIALFPWANTVSPAESVVSTIRSEGVIVVLSPSENVVVMGVETPEGIVMAPLVAEMTVSPAEFTDVSYVEADALAEGCEQGRSGTTPYAMEHLLLCTIRRQSSRPKSHCKSLMQAKMRPLLHATVRQV
jgi:hypothetical protein